MLLTFLLRWLVPYWTALAINPVTGKPSAKNVFAAISFVVGIGGSIVSVTADLWEHRPVNLTAILLLLGNGSLLAGLKVYQGQANRETATPEGQPLAVPNPPGGPAPEIMPQPENPNAPNHQPEQL